MVAIRISKAILVLMVALFCLLVGYNNIVDYGSNFEFTRHVLLMDTTFPGNRLMGRAISSPLLHHAAYWLIIAGELLASALYLAGAIALLRRLRGTQPAFAQAKTLAVCGLTLGLVVWFFGFMTVAGEWFAMWQSPQWNGVESAFRFVVCIGVVLIYVAQNESA